MPPLTVNRVTLRSDNGKPTPRDATPAVFQAIRLGCWRTREVIHWARRERYDGPAPATESQNVQATVSLQFLSPQHPQHPPPTHLTPSGRGPRKRPVFRAGNWHAKRVTHGRVTLFRASKPSRKMGPETGPTATDAKQRTPTTQMSHSTNPHLTAAEHLPPTCAAATTKHTDALERTHASTECYPHARSHTQASCTLTPTRLPPHLALACTQRCSIAAAQLR